MEVQQHTMRLAIALTLCLIAGSALAADPPSAPAVVAKPADLAGVTVTSGAAAPIAEDPVICRSTASTGSRLRPAKVCKKRSDWAADAKSRGRAGDEIKMLGCDSGGTNCGVSDRPPGG